ncbi:MAG: DUF1499 domain-containing protein [Candidatus Binatia bacterium]
MSGIRTSALLVAAAVLAGCAASKPDLGMTDRRFAACGRWASCASTQEERFALEPIPYEGSRLEAGERLVEAIRSTPGSRLVTVTPDYVRAEFTSPVLRFVDDVEAYLDPAENEIHLRSASRRGLFDFGWNRWRIEEIRRRFGAAPAAAPASGVGSPASSG